MKEHKNFVQMVIAVISFLGKKCLRFFSWYKKIWLKFTHNKYDEFIYKRGISMVIATIAIVVVIPTFLMLILNTTYYLTTYKKEIVYLNQSEEIYPDDNIWGVRGCYNQYCDSDSSLYFRIKPSVFNHLWSILKEGRIFLPDTIGSSVPTGLTRCEVVSYGVRMRLTMLLNIYPNILKITCELK